MWQGISLKSERNNPWFNILLHTQSIECCHNLRSMFYLGYITLGNRWMQRHFQEFFKLADSNYDSVLIKHNLFFSYVRVIQNHPPTLVRNSKYLAIPPTPLPLRNIKMATYYSSTYPKRTFSMTYPTPFIPKGLLWITKINFGSIII